MDKNLWCLNWSRIDRYLHNEMILNVVRNHKDYNPADENVWRSLLLVADSRLNSPTQPQSDPISVCNLEISMTKLRFLGSRSVSLCEGTLQDGNYVRQSQCNFLKVGQFKRFFSNEFADHPKVR